jgi:sortase A
VTALRPEHDAYGVPPEGYGQGHGDAYDPQQQVYGARGDLGAAVDRLADPLNDPLPGQQQAGWVQEPYGGFEGVYGAYSTPEAPQQQYPSHQQYPHQQASHQQAPQQQYPPRQEPQEWYDPEGYRRDWYGPQQAAPYAPPQQQAYVPEQQPYAPEPQAYVPEPRGYDAPPQRRIAEPEPETEFAYETGPGGAGDDGGRDGAVEPVRTGGRAERRKGAKGARGRAPAGPAAKESTGVVVSRLVGELFITFGVVMLLFVTYQLWWTNVRAGMQADGATHSLQDGWEKAKKDGAKPAGAFEPGQGFAIMHIPKLDVKVPVAEGIDKHKVLDRGMVGHYADGGLKTAMPGDKQGNFAVAGHRNTHGEPFRYVNKLVKGDKIVVETQDTFYTYEMTSVLPQTSPSNVGVIQPVPPGSGFTKPGRYITLTTCTPEFTSTYRLIVWGKMVEERPRSKGLPTALGG